MDDEKETLGLGSYLPEGSKWKDLCELSGTDLVDKYEEILKECDICVDVGGGVYDHHTEKKFRSNGKIYASASGHEAIESKNKIEISGGEVYAYASDDAINAAGDFTISGVFSAPCGITEGSPVPGIMVIV